MEENAYIYKSATLNDYLSCQVFLKQCQSLGVRGFWLAAIL